MPVLLLFNGGGKMKRNVLNLIVTGCCFIALTAVPVLASGSKAAKPSPDEAIAILKAGNERFVSGKATQPHTDPARLALAGTENQGDHAYATVRVQYNNVKN